VVEVNVFPDAECEAASRRTRKIGLGVMGFADLLLSIASCAARRAIISWVE
jgi:ribonucleoside-diphosphate reductase alpha chain